MCVTARCMDCKALNCSTRAGQLGGPNARFEVGDIRAIPCANSEFDIAYCDKVLIHVDPPKTTLTELVRVTRCS